MSAAAGIIGAIISALGAGAASAFSSASSRDSNQANLDYLYTQLALNNSQMNKERAWQQKKYASDLDFANRQLQSQMDIANQNFNLQNEQFQYQKDLNALQMQREDTAFQRQIADLTSAGFSPLAAIGGNGAAAGSLNAGTAPQLDASGIAQASGQYLDLARQYASLHQELTSKDIEQRQAAAFAIAQMKQDLHFKNQSLANEMFNSAVNASNKRLQNESLREDIQTKKYANSWYAEHGYSQTTLATVLSDFLNREDVKQAKERFANIIAGGLNNLGNAIQNTTGALKEVVEDITKNHNKPVQFSANENQEMVDSLSDSESEFVFDWCKSHKKSISELTLDDWLELAADEKRSRRSK